MSPRIKWLLIVPIAIGFGIWRSSSRWSSDSDEARTIVMNIVKTFDCYDENKQVLDQCADRAHKSAFGGAYKPAGRFRASDIDGDTYIESFFRSLADQFDLINRQDLKKCLADFRAKLKEDDADDTKQ